MRLHKYTLDHLVTAVSD